ncbi:hypothetical protein TWF718_009968 [Orbilia javanica]|uniref:RNase H type-1 domain-containing protein n=1 Tax=Orbilia javanica TaxID=47235 RepID=A0AAN8MJS4_9PEZI
MSSPRGLVILGDEVDHMDLTVVTVPFTGYLPTGEVIKFRCVKQLPMSMLDIGFFKSHLLDKKSVSWTANWTLSFPGFQSEIGSCVFPMAKDRSYNKEDGEAFMFRSRIGENVRVHALGIVTLPIVVYGIAVSIQCLLVDKMYLMPLPENTHGAPLIIDNRLFDGIKLPLKLTIFRQSFVMKRGKAELCLGYQHNPDQLSMVICISVSSACIEYGKHIEEESDDEGGDGEEAPRRGRSRISRKGPKPRLYEDLIGKNHCGAGIFFAPDSQFNVSRRLEDEIDTPERAELQTAIEAMKCLNSLIKNTGYNFRTVVVLTDSEYVCQSTESPMIVLGWAMQGWKTETGEDVPNADLWDEYVKHIDFRRPVTWKLCKSNPDAPAAALARTAAMENIFLNEGSEHDRRDRERSLPAQFFEVPDRHAGDLYEAFVNREAERTVHRINSVIFDGGVCAKDLPAGFYSMVDCRSCRRLHSYPDSRCKDPGDSPLPKAEGQA